MSGTLISALVLSLVLHGGFFIFGPGIQSIQVKKIKEKSIEVEMFWKEVPIPDALQPRPIPKVPDPKPLDLKRLLIRKEIERKNIKPNFKIEHKLSPSPKIQKSLLATRMPRLNMSRPVAPLSTLAFHKKGNSSTTSEEISLPLAMLGAGEGLAPGKNPVVGLPTEDVRHFEKEVSRNAVLGGSGSGRQSIRGPVAARKVVFRPPPPKVKNLESSGDIELRFWVLPDGTVGRVIPIRKGNVYLETVASNHVRQWRFSALRHDEPSREEWGQIIYHFRVR